MWRVGQVPWPVEAVTEYVRKGYWRQQVLGDLPARWATSYGDGVAIVDGEVELTYAELAAAGDSVAEQLLGLGLGDGDNVLLQLPNCWEFVPILFGCARIGVAPVMVLPAYREYEVSYLARAAEAAAIIVPDTFCGFDFSSLAHRVGSTVEHSCQVLVVGAQLVPDRGHQGAVKAPSPGPEDVAVLLLSGGTTGGLPKLIARTHNDYEYNFRRSGEVCGFSADTVYLVVLPMGHNFALGSPGVLGALAVGGKVVLLPTPEPEVAFLAIAGRRVTTVAAVPAVAQRWLESFDPGRHDVSSLALVQVGGARCPAEVAARIVEEFECTVQQVYGMAEGLLNYTRLDDPLDVVTSTQGRPIGRDDEIKIVDAEDNPCELGELLTRGPYTPRGYFRGGSHDERSFTADGWYRTGDVVQVHPSGNLIVEGRVKDLINRAGEKIAALEIEDLAHAIPQVVTAAGIPVPDPVTGERLCLCVVLRPGTRLELSELREVLLGKGIARFKVPEQLEVLDELPLTPVGKPDKKRLQQMVAMGTTARPSS